VDSNFLKDCIRILARLATAGCFVSTMVAGSVHLQRGNNRVDVMVDGKLFTTYYYGSDVAKPYLMPLRTASGVIVTRGFPEGNDVSAGNPKASSFEPHQRPLYFGHGNVDSLDFWQEPAFDKYYTDHGH
jgi:Methane oxygenase PmoA